MTARQEHEIRSPHKQRSRRLFDKHIGGGKSSLRPSGSYLVFLCATAHDGTYLEARQNIRVYRRDFPAAEEGCRPAFGSKGLPFDPSAIDWAANLGFAPLCSAVIALRAARASAPPRPEPRFPSYQAQQMEAP